MGLRFVDLPVPPKPPRKPRQPRVKKEPVPAKEVAPERTAFAQRVDERIKKGISGEQDIREVGAIIDQERERLLQDKLGDLNRRIDDQWAEYASAEEEMKRWRLGTPERSAAKKRLEGIRRLLNQMRATKPDFYAEALRDTLAQIRPLGGVELKWTPGSDPKAVGFLERALANYPTAWLEASVKRGPLAAGIRQRGYYSSSAREIMLSTDERLPSVNYHELAHRWEDVVPGISRMERAFHERRTAGEQPRQLNPGSKKPEWARFDRYVKPYMGREYKGFDFFEIFSMGVEAMYRNTYDLSHDADYRHFILGILGAM